MKGHIRWLDFVLTDMTAEVPYKTSLQAVDLYDSSLSYEERYRLRQQKRRAKKASVKPVSGLDHSLIVY